MYSIQHLSLSHHQRITLIPALHSTNTTLTPFYRPRIALVLPFVCSVYGSECILSSTFLSRIIRESEIVQDMLLELKFREKQKLLRAASTSGRGGGSQVIHVLSLYVITLYALTQDVFRQDVLTLFVLYVPTLTLDVSKLVIILSYSHIVTSYTLIFSPHISHILAS